jgi:hypothetical protein
MVTMDWLPIYSVTTLQMMDRRTEKTDQRRPRWPGACTLKKAWSGM